MPSVTTELSSFHLSPGIASDNDSQRPSSPFLAEKRRTETRCNRVRLWVDNLLIVPTRLFILVSLSPFRVSTAPFQFQRLFYGARYGGRVATRLVDDRRLEALPEVRPTCFSHDFHGRFRENRLICRCPCSSRFTIYIVCDETHFAGRRLAARRIIRDGPSI